MERWRDLAGRLPERGIGFGGGELSWRMPWPVTMRTRVGVSPARIGRLEMYPPDLPGVRRAGGTPREEKAEGERRLFAHTFPGPFSRTPVLFVLVTLRGPDGLGFAYLQQAEW